MISTILAGLALAVSIGLAIFNSGKGYSQDTSRLELLITQQLGALREQLAKIPSQVMNMVEDKFVTHDRHDLIYQGLERRVSELERRERE